MMKLYFSPGSCAFATHLALEEAGASYEAIKLNFKTGEHLTDEYLAINPKGRVPALITSHGVLTETPALLVYIAQVFPESGLIPQGNPFLLAKIQEFNSFLASTVHVAHAHKLRGHRWADEQSSFDDMKRKAPETMHACYKLIEEEMIDGPWVMGETYTICDAYLYTISRWLAGDGVAVSDFPKVENHMKLMAKRPAVQKILPLHP
ncbi:MAG: glutathione S-transferase family protein [Hyphomicrobiales bacterium]